MSDKALLVGIWVYHRIYFLTSTKFSHHKYKNMSDPYNRLFRKRKCKPPVNRTIIERLPNTDNIISLGIHGKILRFIFGYKHDFLFFKNYILPWVDLDYKIIQTNLKADFNISVYQHNHMPEFYDFSGYKFIIAGEAYETYSDVPNECFLFLQALNIPKPRQKSAPTLCMWCPPLSPFKNKLCSICDNRGRTERSKMISYIQQLITVDVFNGLRGHHYFDPLSKYGNDLVSLYDGAFV